VCERSVHDYHCRVVAVVKLACKYEYVYDCMPPAACCLLSSVVLSLYHCWPSYTLPDTPALTPPLNLPPPLPHPLQVGTKLSTFSPRELAGVLVALGQLGYTPPPEWFDQVRARVGGGGGAGGVGASTCFWVASNGARVVQGMNVRERLWWERAGRWCLGLSSEASSAAMVQQ
jgi:hypothetical protein